MHPHSHQPNPTFKPTHNRHKGILFHAAQIGLSQSADDTCPCVEKHANQDDLPILLAIK
ncbi:hypothetical protein DSO57_1026821 [Entomophthora muscae]|uniref:Uncharacterized protein n=1 Tax=Entomophthora muscae TaxID=34485 RepID=A0ACC2ULV2_9FUNG|nr:hypothetical protein DSO57_1026821 [Entomophthora muscae]